MDEATAQKVVVIGTLLTLGSTISDSEINRSKLPPAKMMVGAFGAGLLCSIVAEIDAELGAGLMIAISGTAFVRYGIPAINAAGSAKKQQSATPATAPNTPAFNSAPPPSGFGPAITPPSFAIPQTLVPQQPHLTGTGTVAQQTGEAAGSSIQATQHLFG